MQYARGGRSAPAGHPAAAACCRRCSQLTACPARPQFAKRGPLEEYPDEDDYQDWSEGGSEAGGSGSEADAAAQVRGPCICRFGPPDVQAAHDTCVHT